MALFAIAGSTGTAATCPKATDGMDNRQLVGEMHVRSICLAFFPKGPPPNLPIYQSAFGDGVDGLELQPIMTSASSVAVMEGNSLRIVDRSIVNRFIEKTANETTENSIHAVIVQ